MNKQIEKEIAKIVDKYAQSNSRELFRIELNVLVLKAEKEQIKTDRNATMKIINQE